MGSLITKYVWVRVDLLYFIVSPFNSFKGETQQPQKQYPNVNFRESGLTYGSQKTPWKHKIYVLILISGIFVRSF